VASVNMRATVVGGGEDGRVVAQLVSEPDPFNEDAPSGSASIILRGDDAKDAFEQGAIYSVSISRVRGAADDPNLAAVAAARAIPNSTNTAGFKTPAALKVPPPVVPDGVVTLPRPSVVLEPVPETAAPAVAPAPAHTSVEPAKK
jgi:hypothetical protein